jgi:hypothetical protein
MASWTLVPDGEDPTVEDVRARLRPRLNRNDETYNILSILGSLCSRVGRCRCAWHDVHGDASGHSEPVSAASEYTATEGNHIMRPAIRSMRSSDETVVCTGENGQKERFG